MKEEAFLHVWKTPVVAALDLNKLAIDGGAPVRTTAWPVWPTFPADEVAACTEVLTSGKVNYWTGSVGRAFEREFAEFVGVPHAIACSNGTVALELCLHGVGLSTGDGVVVPSRTFVATAHAVVLSGGRPQFADVSADTGNVTADSIEAAANHRTRAVIVVHVAGWPADMLAIRALCDRKGWALIEDCAQAHDAKIAGRSVGSFGDAAAFSFCQDKIMTSGGEGGMVTTSDREIWSRMWSRKDHGKSWDAVYEQEHPPGFRWLHESVGSNGRMTEMQSAIGRVQLSKLPGWVDTRREHAHRLITRLKAHDTLRVPTPGPGIRHAYYRLYAYVRPPMLAQGWSRDRLMAAIEAEGVPCQSGSCSEIYLEAAFPERWRPQARHLPLTKALGEASLCFKVQHTCQASDMDDVAEAVDRVMRVARR